MCFDLPIEGEHESCCTYRMNALEKLRIILEIVNPGASQKDLEYLHTQLALDPVQELIDLYSWCNGIANLNSFLHFDSIEQLVESVKLFEKMSVQVSNFVWNKDWLPLLNMNGDVHILFNVKTGEVAGLDIEMDSFEVISERYQDYIDGLSYAFSHGKFIYEEYAGNIRFETGVWDELWTRFRIKPGYN